MIVRWLMGLVLGLGAMGWAAPPALATGFSSCAVISAQLSAKTQPGFSCVEGTKTVITAGGSSFPLRIVYDAKADQDWVKQWSPVAIEAIGKAWATWSNVQGFKTDATTVVILSPLVKGVDTQGELAHAGPVKENPS